MGWVGPAKYDFQGTRAIKEILDASNSDNDSVASPTDSESAEKEPTSEGGQPCSPNTDVELASPSQRQILHSQGDLDIVVLKSQFRRAAAYSSALTVIVTLISELLSCKLTCIQLLFPLLTLRYSSSTNVFLALRFQ